MQEQDENLELASRIEALEQQLIKGKRPWYRVPSNIFALIALTLSFTTASYSIVRDYNASKNNAAMELSQTVMALTQVQADFASRAEALAQAGIDATTELDALTAKHDSLLSRAVELVDILTPEVNQIHLNTVAFALRSRGSIEQAEIYYALAFDIAETSTDKFLARINLGSLGAYGAPVDKSRQFFRDALGNIETPNEIEYLRGRDYAFRMWACMEVALSYYPEALAALNSAKTELARAPANPNSPFLIQRLASFERFIRELQADGGPFFIGMDNFEETWCR